jgi:hypothetical protein
MGSSLSCVHLTSYSFLLGLQWFVDCNLQFLFRFLLMDLLYRPAAVGVSHFMPSYPMHLYLQVGICMVQFWACMVKVLPCMHFYVLKMVVGPATFLLLGLSVFSKRLVATWLHGSCITSSRLSIGYRVHFREMEFDF